MDWSLIEQKIESLRRAVGRVEERCPVDVSKTQGTFLITIIFEGSGEKIEEEEVAHGLTQIFTEENDLLSFAAQFILRVISER